jgi:hypothetical protein
MRDKSGASDLPCPCCGFLTLSEAYGSYALCSACGWEDDGVQLANPTSGGGANLASLRVAQVAALQKYPLAMTALVDGRVRADRWRPLNADELAQAEIRRAVAHGHSPVVVEPEQAYWAIGGDQPL